MPKPLDSINFKNQNYVKGSLVVKFKPNVLNFETLDKNLSSYDTNRMIDSTTKALSDSLSILLKDIKSYKPLTKIPQRLIYKKIINNDSLINIEDDIYNIVVLYCKEGNEENLAKKLLKSGLVVFAEPNYIIQIDTPPNDGEYYLQRGLDQANDIDIDVEDAWITNTGSQNVKVAILDTGIDYNNDDLGNGNWNVAGAKVRAGYNYYDGNSNPIDNDITSSHGTAVAGIIGAYRNNNNRVAGIAGGDVSIGNLGVSLYALKVFSGSDGSTSPSGTYEALAAALIDAAKPEVDGGYGCNIANYSGGGLSINSNQINLMKDALRYAARHNLLFVAAKGNENTNALHYPSDIKENWVLSVGASDGNDQRALYGGGQGSNWGNNIDVVAPGTTDLVYTTKRVASGSEGSFSGTSAASPVVAGVAALLKSQNTNLHRDDMEQLIKLSAYKIPTYNFTNGYNEEMGFGKINAANAMTYLKTPYKLVQNTITGGTVEDISSTQAFYLSTDVNLPSGYYYGKRYRVRTTIQKPFCSGENYIWPRIEGASVGWSGANPNDQENYIYQNNETSSSVDFTTWVYYIETNTLGQTINAWYPCAPQDIKFSYTALGLEEYYKPNEIQGPTQFCTGSQTYTIPNLPAGATVSWSINPSSGVANLSTSGNTATLTQTGNSNLQLSATINSACGLVAIAPLSVRVGTLPDDAATITIDFADPGNLQCGNIYTARADIDPAYASDLTFPGYQWTSLTPGWNIVGSNTFHSVNFATPAGSSTTGYLELQLQNSCGYSNYYIGMASSCGGGGGGFGFKMAYYPNPANTSLTIQYLETDTTTNNDTVFKEKQVMLLNEKGAIIRNQKLNQKDKKVVLDIRDIPNGTYYLHVKDGKDIIKQQIIINHD